MTATLARAAAAADRRGRVWLLVLLVSLLLHALALLAVYGYRTPPLPDLTPPEAHLNVASDDVAMVFESGQKEKPEQKAEDTRDKAVQDGGARSPEAQAGAHPPAPQPPAPESAAAEPAAPEQAAPNPAAAGPPTPKPAATVTLDASPPSAPSGVLPANPAPSPPVPAKALPAQAARAAPPRPRAAATPAPVPAPVPAPAPARAPAPRQAQNRDSGFPAPQNFSLGANPNAVSSRGNTGAVASARPLGGASPRMAGGRDFLADFSLVSGADPGRDWFGELLKWWLVHRYYPEQAAKNLEQGDPGLRVTVERNGHVRSVELYTRSGSMFLDMGAQGTFRSANLPPFPPQTEGRESVIAINIHYYLIFR